MNRLLGLIKKHKEIDKFDLIMNSGISISYYEKLKPFMERIYAHNVQYDKETKKWRWIREDELNE